jgi:uncharacterized protein (TIGR00299 family) protein
MSKRSEQDAGRKRPKKPQRETILYIEATSGVAGDMLLGAFLDLNVPVEILNEAWKKLGLSNFEVEIFETKKSGLRALQCRVKTTESKGPRTWNEYRKLLMSSGLEPALRDQALALCRRLFEVEAQFHHTSLEKLHLHEMGGTDLLLDVVGSLAAVRHLQPVVIFASPVNTGKGFVDFSHGKYPIPAPATSKLLEGVPIFQNEVDGELTTPTGALLLTHLTRKFGELPPMILESVGIGAGERDTGKHPNVLRIFKGSMPESQDTEEIYMVESNIDDSSPQILAHFMEQAFEKGALDVFFTPVFMKKNRPASRLTLLSSESNLRTICRLVFSETTAIGLRYWRVGRQKLQRRWTKVKIDGTEVRIKEGFLEGTLYNYQPEYEDCKTVAEKLKKPVKEIMARAIQVYLNRPQTKRSTK